MFYSALVLLDAIIVSWASHAKMTRTRIRKWNYVLLYAADKSSATPKIVIEIVIESLLKLKFQ